MAKKSFGSFRGSLCQNNEICKHNFDRKGHFLSLEVQGSEVHYAKLMRSTYTILSGKALFLSGGGVRTPQKVAKKHVLGASEVH